MRRMASVFRNLVTEYPFRVNRFDYIAYKFLKLYTLLQYMVFGIIETVDDASALLLLFIFTNLAYNRYATFEPTHSLYLLRVSQ